MVNWTPEGFIGQTLATTRPYAAAPPPGAQPPPLWGRSTFVPSSTAGAEVSAERQTLRVDQFPDPALVTARRA
jgi:hypothetical protein